MPLISQFYGITILMYFQEHNPPYFHAKYGGKIAVFQIRSGKMVKGKLPLRAQRLIREWIRLHKDELLVNWEKAQKDGKLKKIRPLE